jgi:Zn-dependent alcohol dehydrogenase
MLALTSRDWSSDVCSSDLHIALADINDGFLALQRGETIRSVVMF